MAKMITRTFATHTIHAVAIDAKNPTQQIPVDPLTVNDPSMDNAKAVALLMKRDKTKMYIVTKIDTDAKVMGISEDDFLKYAVEIKR